MSWVVIERVLRFGSSLLSEKTGFTQCNVVSSCSIGGLFETEHGSEPLQQSFPCSRTLTLTLAWRRWRGSGGLGPGQLKAQIWG